jgi:hypothetical protein
MSVLDRGIDREESYGSKVWGSVEGLLGLSSLPRDDSQQQQQQQQQHTNRGTPPQRRRSTLASHKGDTG